VIRGNADKKGYVYILVNPAFPGFLKIGKTTKNPESRARELSSGSGVPTPYAVAWDAFVEDCDQVERLIHQQLAHARSRNDREFFAMPLKNAISVLARIVSSFSCEPAGSPDDVPAAAVDAASSLVESKATAMSDSPIGLRTIPSLEAAGYSAAEINDLQSALASFERFVLPHKKKREADAEEILRRHRGEYTDTILDEVFDKVDKGPIGPVKGPWFGEALSIHNRNNVYALYRRSTAGLNVLIDRLRETGNLGSLGEWRRAGNRGMRTGVATLFMYLHSPDRYNVWLPKNHNGLSRLCNLGTRFPKKEISPEEYRVLYNVFNQNAIAVREENGLAPQTVDWFLFAVDEIKTNPRNPGLRALIEGRSE
jgi:hypothetical protein